MYTLLWVNTVCVRCVCISLSLGLDSLEFSLCVLLL
jgi:hypothetical protein